MKLRGVCWDFSVTRCFIVILCMLRGASWSPPVMTLNLRAAISQQQRDLPSGRQSHSSTPHTDQQCVPLFLCFFYLNVIKGWIWGKLLAPFQPIQLRRSHRQLAKALACIVLSFPILTHWTGIVSPALLRKQKTILQWYWKKGLREAHFKDYSLKPHGVFMWRILKVPSCLTLTVDVVQCTRTTLLFFCAVIDLCCETFWRKRHL